MYVISQKKISLKEDTYFHAMQTTPIRQPGLLAPCCSDQDVTSPDNNLCMYVSLFVLLPASVPHPPIPATPGT